MTRGRPGGGDVVFTFSQLTWHAARARGMYFPEDRLAQALADDRRVTRLVVANQVRSAPLVGARRLLSREDDGFPAGATRALVQPLRLARGEPTDARGVRRVFAAYDRTLRRAAGRMRLERPAVITANPLVAAHCALDWAGPVTYYAVDDWAAHPGYAHQREAIQDAYARMRERAVRVCAVSARLLGVLDPHGPALLVPNGIDPGEWADPPPARASGPAGPRLVYVGTLDGRLDVDALLRLAAAMPTASIELTGPVTDAEHLRPLWAASNIHLRPPAGREEIVRTLFAADVCLLPHRRSALTDAMSPLKLYEYLAAGRPVVATDLEPVRGIDPRVTLVPPGGDLTAATLRALAQGPASELERRTFVRRNSWATRHERILDGALA